ncbi:hypothetical protein [Actinoplanes sp. RD1]|uniref:hypothetical protein n=1 Tax=Actinoplanes sp. RD1 TaxID=3064538 RepID=UPI0027427E05|nr:hypothetical protein [Actinoplanes sp. RD1]
MQVDAQLPTPSRSPTWWWFLIPVLTIGFGAFVMVFLGGWRLKSRPHIYAAGGYLLTTMIYICTTGAMAPAEGDPASDPSSGFGLVIAAFVVICWLGGTLHTLILQTMVARLAPRTKPIQQVPVTSDPAIAAARWRSIRRAEARQLMQHDPGMAWELRIGRPDLQGRQYDDGGLIDVNHVPADWLAHVLDLPQALAEEIMEVRTRRHGLNTADELVVYCDGMTPERLDRIRDFLVFRPL